MTRINRSHFVVLLCILTLLPGLTQVVAQSDSPDETELDMVVGRVGDVEVTAEDFVQRLRFERLRYYMLFEQLVEDEGPQVLQMDDPTNQLAGPVMQVISLLVDDDQFFDRIYNLMMLEVMYHQEAMERGIQVDECEIEAIWSQVLNIGAPTDCPAGEEFNLLRQAFIEKAQTFAGMTAEEIEQIVINRAEYERVFTEVGESLEIAEVPAMRSRHIRVTDEETANEVLDRLEAGEPFEELLVDYTTDSNPTGNGGELGPISPGEVDATFETAAFDAEVGEIVGPVETPFGYHIIQVTDSVLQVRARHILFEEEAGAQTAVRLLNEGADFAELAQLYSIDTGSGMRGGDLGFFGPGQMVPEFEEAVFSAEIGEIVGPIESQFGFHVIEVTEYGDVPAAVDVRHIVLDTEEEAQEVLDRLNDGADFAELAREVSIDSSAAGHQGDTLAVFSFGGQRGLYSRDQVGRELADAVFESEPGEMVGPVAYQGSYYVIDVQDQGTRLPSQPEIQAQRDEFAFEWQVEQVESGRVEMTHLWRQFITLEPPASEYNPALTPLDSLFEQARETYLMMREEANLLNTLRRLTLPEDIDRTED